MFVFSYTSGTTGTPKATMISHFNLVATLASCHVCVPGITKDDYYLSYLPLAHMLERLLCWSLTRKGGKIGCFNGNIKKLTLDIAELRPNVFVSVPRLYNKFYDKINGKIASQTGFKK